MAFCICWILIYHSSGFSPPFFFVTRFADVGLFFFSIIAAGGDSEAKC
jgi:hypothetical protein